MEIADNHKQKILAQCSYEITGPVIFDFVRWILDEALKRRISTLYFLARDGYTPYQIAKMIVEQAGYSISCKYLYCSRRSLRIPSYHLIGEETYELLSLGGYCVTANSLFDRGAISEEDRQRIAKELKMTDEERGKTLSKRELAEFSQKICKNRTYRTAVMTASKDAYPATVGYLRQEGLFEQETVAIVDSGWTGSMQRSLRQLLESDGFTGKIVGFYFGMYAKPKDEKDGEYLTYYFDHSGAVKDKVLFCNNLFECILSAPHGMTLAYVEKSGCFEPVLGNEPDRIAAELIKEQSRTILAYATKQFPKCQRAFDKNAALSETRNLLHRLMAKPSKEEAVAYGGFRFNDDIADGAETALASVKQVASLRGYFVLKRMLRKLCKNCEIVPELFWAYGTIALLPAWKRWWYWWNVAAWEWLKYSF